MLITEVIVRFEWQMEVHTNTEASTVTYFSGLEIHVELHGAEDRKRSGNSFSSKFLSTVPSLFTSLWWIM
jgi:hypothetical protein